MGASRNNITILDSKSLGRSGLSSGSPIVMAVHNLASNKCGQGTEDVPLRFIDESQRQISTQIRKDIRSHVRKGSHVKKRKLNAATKSRPLGAGARKLLQKAPEEVSSNSSPENPQSGDSFTSKQPVSTSIDNQSSNISRPTSATSEYALSPHPPGSEM